MQKQMDYTLEKRGDLVVVHRPFREEAVYNLDGAKMTLVNIIVNRKSFATEEATRHRLTYSRK
jgi:hypothetical protein